jgi:hypothetical protein
MLLHPQADGVRVQVELQMPYDKLPQLLALVGQPAGAVPVGHDNISNNKAGKPAGAGSTEPEITPTAAAAATSAQQPESLLQDMDPDELRQQLELYNAECEQQQLYTFTGTTPETGVSICINGRYVLVPRPTQDGGCVPNLMSKRFADAVGISYTPGADPVCNIEGLGATNMKWRTQPVQLVLARGTPGELVLDVKEGFTVVDGDEAAAMYDIIMGRRALAPVSGFVMPFQRKFYYAPGLQLGKPDMYSLPVRVGYKRSVQRMTADAAAAFEQPYSFWLGGACLQDWGTPTVSTDTKASWSASSDSEPPGLTGTDSDDDECHSLPHAPRSSTPHARFCVDYRSLNSQVTGKQQTNLRLLLLLLWPLFWLFDAVDGFYSLLVQERPYQPKRFYRLSRWHRAADGETISLRLAPGSSGNKPRIIDVHRRHLTWRFAFTTVPARMLLVMLLVMLFSVTQVSAMRTVMPDTPPSALWGHRMQALPFPAPSHTHMLLASLDLMVGGTFRPLNFLM